MNPQRLLPIILALALLLYCSSCKNTYDDLPDAPEVPVTPPAETAPEAPTNLEMTAFSESEVRLRWVDNSSVELSFIIEQSTDNVNFSQVKSTSANTDTTSLTGPFLTTKTYYFRVRSKKTTALSNASNIVSRSLFPAPSALTIVSFTPSSVQLQWVDNSPNETAFLLQLSINGSPYTNIDSTLSNVTSRTISGVFDSAKTYSFRLYAKDAKNISGFSNAEARTFGRWVFVAGGTFSMGRVDQFRDERPVHSVTLSGYYIGKYEVTVKEYRAFITATKRTMPDAPSWGWNDDEPMVKVSWNDANAYCQWLDTVSTGKYRLPTEAEWEFAARGGNNSQGFAYSGSNTAEQCGWIFTNAGGRTRTVGLKKSNELGIFDMSGNAWEWCNDWQSTYPASPQLNPVGPAGGSFKIFRGGSWFDYGLTDAEGRVETRYAYTPNNKVDDGGFRIIRLP
ncbi:MAG: SUMF1/EgtB/PvdO family nonheme iron enzyme [Bacteroidota bacterium]